MARGGKRPGAGRPKGSKSPGTLEKEVAREMLRQKVFERLGPLVDAQIDNSLGLKYLVARNKRTGKFERLKALAIPLEGDSVEGGEETEVIEVWEKDPSVHAFTDLMDRAMDKAAQPVKNEHEGDVTVTVRWQS